MRTPGLIAVACVVAFAAFSPAPLRAADKNKDLIVGKWEGTRNGQKGTVEFGKDGALKIMVEDGDKKVTLEGKYKFVDDDNLEYEVASGGQTRKEKLKVKATKDELALTDPKGKEQKFKKVN